MYMYWPWYIDTILGFQWIIFWYTDFSKINDWAFAVSCSDMG